MTRTRILALMLTMLLGLGCATKPTGGPAGESAIKTAVAAAIEENSIDSEYFTGRTVAVESVDVRPQVTAIIQKVFFKDGDLVKKGQPLYQLDDRTFKADLAQIESNIRSTEASLVKNSADLGRARRLRIGDSISREDYDKIAASKDEAQAALAANQAKADFTKTNLSYTRINSDINGRISKTNVTVGNLATANQTLLTNIVSVDTMRAEFDVDERTVLRIGKRIVEGKFKTYQEAKLPVYLATQIDKDYPYPGTIDFVDNRLNQGTGTLLVRGLFANDEASLKHKQPLRPGLFVRLRMPMGGSKPTVFIREQAVLTDQDRKFVYVVNEDNEVQARPVILGSLRDGMRVVEEGLKKGELVVLNNMQRLRPGMKIEPREIKMRPAPVPADAKK